MIQNILVLGAGSAGLIAALTLKTKFPSLNITIVRSLEIGTIGVGEGTTPNFPRQLFEIIGIDAGKFYKEAEPTWKLGIRFLWGSRKQFDYAFSLPMDTQWPGLPRPTGFYCQEDDSCVDMATALMRHDRAFERNPQGGGPVITNYGFHIENHKLIRTLESEVLSSGIQLIDGTMETVQRTESGVKSITLKDGRQLEADFFVDASGFRSELLGGAYQEPFVSYDQSLFCDRAVVGGWDRTVEPILPYTVAETMDCGWSWQIEHETRINRGYVYSSQAITDEAAEQEFRRKNPKIVGNTRIIKFRSGRYRRFWVDNVVAIGNSGGFVEPLEATALMVVCTECTDLAGVLDQCTLEPTPSIRAFYNNVISETWDEIRDFLGLHYKLNTRLDTPFWRHCRADTDISRLDPLLNFYEENGPCGLCRYMLPKGPNSFGLEGWLVHLIGNQYPHKKKHTPSLEELGIWNSRRATFAAQAKQSLTVEQSLAIIRDPRWAWAKSAAQQRRG